MFYLDEIKGVTLMGSINLIPTMTSYTTPSGVVFSSGESSNSGYPAWKAFDKNFTSSSWYGTGTVPNIWVGYEFTSPTIIGKYTMTISAVANTPSAWVFEGSNDGVKWNILHETSNVTWTVAEKKEYSFRNYSPHLKYRVRFLSRNSTTIEIREIEMFDPDYLNKFLISSSNEKVYSIRSADTTINVARTSGVTVTASQTHLGSPSALCDGLMTANSWYALSNKNVWIDIEFPTSKAIYRYTMATTAGGMGLLPSPKDWALQGSNDNFLTFDTLDTRTNITGWVDSIKRVFDVPINNIKLYKKYRIYIFQSGNATEGTNLGEIEMYEDYTNLICFENKAINEYDLISIGLNKGFVIDMNKSFPTRIDVSSSSSVLGTGKVFKKVINTASIPIKKVTIT